MRARLQRITKRRQRRGRHRRPARLTRDQRSREAAKPEDVGTYTCPCGFQWEAAVSTSVDCPHCGASQAW
jgi:predicted RNA-binding Zn-ribbon protein involved in translation (DUF1610 family)